MTLRNPALGAALPAMTKPPADQRVARDPHRPISITELFTIGIGPSSSHTVGPMRAAFAFGRSVAALGQGVSRVQCTLHGSLALTGRGHGTDRAVLLGLSGWEPETIDPDQIGPITHTLAIERQLLLGGAMRLGFDPERDLIFDPVFLPGHPNALVLIAEGNGGIIRTETWFSVGGGMVQRAGDAAAQSNIALRHPFSSAADLLARTVETGQDIADLVRANEAAWRTPDEADAFLDQVRDAMMACILRGINAGPGELPGGLKVRRRAHALSQSLMARGPRSDPSAVFEWVSLWALAVNEENAAGGRVVTAPTNGAAGVIPAVLRYYETFVHGASREGVRRFLYTASAIGFLYKKRASISAAEMGCQGEVGVACSMAAAGLASALGATAAQIENAAEIGMEHNLGLTCDPIGGLVQVPCIERNTMGAIKAINAATLALHGDGSHIVSLDAVIETMRQTGEDMKSHYKETSLGGLAVNVVAC